MYLHANCPEPERAAHGIELWAMAGVNLTPEPEEGKEFWIKRWSDVYSDTAVVERIYCRGCGNAVVTFTQAEPLANVEGNLADRQYEPVIVWKEQAS